MLLEGVVGGQAIHRLEHLDGGLSRCGRRHLELGDEVVELEPGELVFAGRLSVLIGCEVPAVHTGQRDVLSRFAAELPEDTSRGSLEQICSLSSHRKTDSSFRVKMRLGRP